jgi:hypothetical protein
MLTGAAPYDGHMTSATSLPDATVAHESWIGPVLRALPAGVVGLTITFTANHSPALGLVMFAVFGLGSAVLLGATSVKRGSRDALRSLHGGLAIIAGLVGSLSLVVLTVMGAGLAMLLLLVGGYAVVAGGFELVWGIRHRGRSLFARDALVIGGATLALAVVLALVGDSVSAVGFFGAYAVMLAIYLLIAGFSLKWSTSAKESTV